MKVSKTFSMYYQIFYDLSAFLQLDGLKMCDKIKIPGLDYFVSVLVFDISSSQLKRQSVQCGEKKVNITAHHVFSGLPWQTKDSPKQKERQLASYQERIKKMPEIVEKVMCPFFLLFVRFVSRSLYEQRKPSFSY